MGYYHDREATHSPEEIIVLIRGYIFNQLQQGKAAVRRQDFDPDNGVDTPCTNLQIKMAAASLLNLPKGTPLDWDLAWDTVIQRVLGLEA